MICAPKLAGALGGALIFGITIALGQNLNVKIIDRQDKEDTYDYAAVYNSALTGTTFVGKTFRVRGATFTLQLPDGRLVVVNCDGKFAERLSGPVGNRRSCRAPLVENIQVDFKGDKAKLIWPVSVDGSKVQSETYVILGVLSQQQSVAAPPMPSSALAATKQPVPANTTQDAAARRIWAAGMILGSAATNQLFSESPEIQRSAKTYAIKSSGHAYLVSSDDELKSEGPEVLISVESGKVFVLGDGRNMKRACSRQFC